MSLTFFVTVFVLQPTPSYSKDSKDAVYEYCIEAPTINNASRSINTGGAVAALSGLFGKVEGSKATVDTRSSGISNLSVPDIIRLSQWAIECRAMIRFAPDDPAIHLEIVKRLFSEKWPEYGSNHMIMVDMSEPAIESMRSDMTDMATDKNNETSNSSRINYVEVGINYVPPLKELTDISAAYFRAGMKNGLHKARCVVSKIGAITLCTGEFKPNSIEYTCLKEILKKIVLSPAFRNGKAESSYIHVSWLRGPVISADMLEAVKWITENSGHGILLAAERPSR